MNNHVGWVLAGSLAMVCIACAMLALLCSVVRDTDQWIHQRKALLRKNKFKVAYVLDAMTFTHGGTGPPLYTANMPSDSAVMSSMALGSSSSGLHSPVVSLTSSMVSPEASVAAAPEATLAADICSFAQPPAGSAGKGRSGATGSGNNPTPARFICAVHRLSESRSTSIPTTLATTASSSMQAPTQLGSLLQQAPSSTSTHTFATAASAFSTNSTTTTTSTSTPPASQTSRTRSTSSRASSSTVMVSNLLLASPAARPSHTRIAANPNQPYPTLQPGSAAGIRPVGSFWTRLRHFVDPFHHYNTQPSLPTTNRTRGTASDTYSTARTPIAPAGTATAPASTTIAPAGTTTAPMGSARASIASFVAGLRGEMIRLLPASLQPPPPPPVPDSSTMMFEMDIPHCHVEPHASAADSEQCLICLGEYEQGEQLVQLPCSHLYHRQCFHDWLMRTGNCPICKFDVKAHFGLVTSIEGLNQGWAVQPERDTGDGRESPPQHSSEPRAELALGDAEVGLGDALGAAAGGPGDESGDCLDAGCVALLDQASGGGRQVSHMSTADRPCAGDRTAGTQSQLAVAEMV